MSKDKKTNKDETQIIWFSKEHAVELQNQRNELMKECADKLMEIAFNAQLCRHDIALVLTHLLANHLVHKDIGVYEVLSTIGFDINEIFDNRKKENSPLPEGKESNR